MASTLAAGDYDNRVRVWDVQTGTHLQTLKGQAGHVSDVAFSLNRYACERELGQYGATLESQHVGSSA